MMSNKMRISLDSNVFRDLDFIEWLQIQSANFSISLSVIVYLETFHWYNLRGIDKTLFDEEMRALNLTIRSLVQDEVEEISNNTIVSKLQFKHHIRDIIIGTHATIENCKLITLNKKHFEWMKEKSLSPNELIMLVENES